MTNFELKLLTINRFLFILGFIFLAIIVMASSLFIVELSGIELLERELEEITITYLIGALILAPLIETYIFQKLLIDHFSNRIKQDWQLILISAIPFGVLHYIVDLFIRDIYYAFCFGVVFAYAYILAIKRVDLNAYWAVVLIHAGFNLFGVIIHVFIV